MGKRPTQFGFTVHKDRQIDLDNAELDLYRKICAVEPSIHLCFSCGTCAATCTAARLTSFSLRKIILQVRRGQLQGLQDEVKNCMLCGKCQLACPRGVSTRNLILQINKSLKTNGR